MTIFLLVSMTGDPTAEAAEAAAADDDLLYARVRQARLTLYAASDAGNEQARAILSSVEPRIATVPVRERLPSWQPRRGPTAIGAAPHAGWNRHCCVIRVTCWRSASRWTSTTSSATCRIYATSRRA